MRYKNEQSYVVKAWRNDAFNTDINLAMLIMNSTTSIDEKSEKISQTFFLDLELAKKIVEFKNLMVFILALKDLNTDATLTEEVICITKNSNKLHRIKFNTLCKKSLERSKIIVACLALHANSSQLKIIGNELNMPRRMWMVYREVLRNNVEDFCEKFPVIVSKDFIKMKRWTKRATPQKVKPAALLVMDTMKGELSKIIEDNIKKSFFPMSKSLIDFSLLTKVNMNSLPDSLLTDIHTNFNDLMEKCNDY